VSAKDRDEVDEALKLATTRFELALAGSNTGVWDYTLVLSGNS
jgi:hypothetical protein